MLVRDEIETLSARIIEVETRSAALQAAIIEYLVYFGGQHEDEDCPGDDTCECPRVQAVEAALKLLATGAT